MVNWMNSRLASDQSREVSGWKLGRSPYLVDYGAVIHSSAFRRSSHKTQVYMSPTQDFVRTRLTHSVEASQLGRQLSRYLLSILDRKSFKKYRSKAKFSEGDFVRDFEDLVSSACLAHDLGHPPFGHRGEDVLNKLVKTEGEEFDANKQNIRLLLGSAARLPLDVSNALVDAVVKYKCPEKFKGKTGNGAYRTEAIALGNVLKKTGLVKIRHPACYLMEASDDIAYLSGDLEDAIKLGEISPAEIARKLTAHGAEVLDPRYRKLKTSWKRLIEDSVDNPSRVSSYFMKWLVFECCKNIKRACNGVDLEQLPVVMDESASTIPEAEMNLLYLSRDGGEIKKLKDYLYKENLLISEKVSKERIFGGNVIKELWETFSPLLSMSTKDDIKKSFEFNILPHHIKSRINLVLKKEENISRSERVRLIRDYISGMTDRYAINLWQTLKTRA